jgi:hypothetical protein
LPLRQHAEIPEQLDSNQLTLVRRDITTGAWDRRLSAITAV